MTGAAPAASTPPGGWVRRHCPRSILGWTIVLATGACWLVILAMIASVLKPSLLHPDTLGGHDWDQMEAHRYLVKKTILRFHQFPFWNPYACGGHTTWGGFESGTVIVSPWLPFYLAMSLPHAMRIEIWGSALIGALGTWLLAGRFARSPAVRAFVVVAFVVNGRWTLQLAAGHTWHLVYAFTPWCLYFYDRAVAIDPGRGTGRTRDVVLCGIVMALMVYMGGIYPLPETVLLMAGYAALLAVMTRSARPVLLLSVAGLISLGLSAPKLLPILEVLSRFPRRVDSMETLDIGAFIAALTSKQQDMNSPHPGTTQWGWHEWGIYVGWAVVALVVVGTLFARGVRERSLRWVGLAALVLGFGGFDSDAPWPILHHWVPIFRSQHVPSRWMYPALLLLLLVTASLLDALLQRTGRIRSLFEIALVVGVAWIAQDIAEVARQTLTHAFTTSVPATVESTGPFHNEISLPRALAYAADYAPPSLPAEIANIGTIQCGMFPGLNIYFLDRNGRARGLGARGREDPAYKGEAFVAEGTGQATITRWSPNEVTVAVHGAKAGEHAVLNQNWDPGWSANGLRVVNWADQVAVELREPDREIVFRYRPRLLWPGMALLVATIGAIVYCFRVEGRGRRTGRASVRRAAIPASA